MAIAKHFALHGSATTFMEGESPKFEAYALPVWMWTVCPRYLLNEDRKFV